MGAGHRKRGLRGSPGRGLVWHYLFKGDIRVPTAVCILACGPSSSSLLTHSQGELSVGAGGESCGNPASAAQTQFRDGTFCSVPEHESAKHSPWTGYLFCE